MGIGVVGLFKLGEGGHDCLGHELAAEAAKVAGRPDGRSLDLLGHLCTSKTVTTGVWRHRDRVIMRTRSATLYPGQLTSLFLANPGDDRRHECGPVTRAPPGSLPGLVVCAAGKGWGGQSTIAALAPVGWGYGVDLFL